MQAYNDSGPLCCDADTMEKARNGDSFAQLDLGNAYYAAYQMENNCSLAFKWISLSAQQGNMEAQFRLGDLYALGQGTEKCHTRAYEWYTKSALQGHSKALTRIHNLYEDDKYMHCKGYQSKDEKSKWSRYYLDIIVRTRELSEYRLQQTVLIQNQAMEFYQQRFNTLIQQKEVKNTGAQLQLGFMYQHGYGTKRSITRAIEWYSTAAKEGGVSEAEYSLGDIYLNKKEDSKHNTHEAFEWFSKAAENGSVMAQCSLAHLYEKGIGVRKDYSKALHWYSLAANMGYTSAQLNIAKIYRTGQGVLQDYNKAIEWYNCAAKGGNRAAQNCLDQLHAQDDRNSGGNNTYYKNPINGRRMNSLLRQHISGVKDMNNAEHLKRLALNVLRRDINAMYNIGIKYRDGVDLPQDKDLSIKWIKKSARGGLEKAQLAIGEIYEQGKLVEQDYHRASIWYKKKPLRKNDIFQYRLGMLYYKGYGIRQDYLEASKWFIKSAEKNNNKSQYQLGVMRNLGNVVRRDVHDAFKWYKKAAHQRNGKAMRALAQIYLEGEITDKDPSTALLWLKHAFSHGGEAAAFDLIDLYKDYKNELKDLKTSNIFLEDPSSTHYKYDIYSSIAVCYLKGYIVEQDYCNAYKFIKKSFALNFSAGKEWFSTPARLEDQFLKLDTDGNDLVAMFLLVSEKGIDNLEYNAGYAYEFGLRGDYSHMIPVKANITKAIEWYMVASKKGDARADYRLGVVYEEGKGSEMNISVAIGFYNKVIEQENTNAMYRLANLYLRGKGVSQNFEKAYQLFTDAHNKKQYYSHLFLKNSGDFLSSAAKDPIKIEVSSDEDDENELLYYSNEKGSNLLSFKMLEAVGHSGNIAVQYQLGCLYGDTGSDDRDYSKAAYWFDLASQGDITDAYYRLGRLYEESQGVEKNYLQSFILYQKAADKHHDKALYRLAQMYQCGIGTPIDFNKAFMFYRKSAEQDNEIGKKVVTFLKGSLNDLSQTMSDKISDLSSSEIDDIIYMYEYVANNGNADIQFGLGYYFESKQLEPDYTRAAKWYSMAKNLGHIDATYRLGRLCELGLGITKDYEYAFELYTVSKEGGLSEATVKLANMYQNGFGVKVDYQQAFDYYTEASEQRNLDAQFKLGQMYDQGIFKSKNTLEALKWFTRSYLQGNEAVRESLYLLYDGDEPYESIFYGRMAKILHSYAKNKDYHLEEKYSGSAEIYARLFHAYLNGQGVQKNSEFAWHYLCIVVKLNTHYPGPIFGESTFHFIKDNISEVYNMALKQSENGDESACIILGTLYLGGVILLEETKEGGKKIYSSVFEDIYDLSDNSLYDENLAIGTVIVPKDYKKALQYFSKAANAGNSYSKLIVGVMYHCGYGAKQNFTKAFEYYQQLLQPHPSRHIAKKCLGYLYAFGEGVDRDNDLALKCTYVEISCRRQFFNIAQIFYYGNEEIRNHKSALKFLLMAEMGPENPGLYLIKKANEHDLNGQSNLTNEVYSLVSGGVVDGEIEYLLGIMHEKGQGTRVNYKEAFDRFSKAAKCGNERAKNHLKLYYKNKKIIK